MRPRNRVASPVLEAEKTAFPLTNPMWLADSESGVCCRERHDGLQVQKCRLTPILDSLR